MRFSIVFSALGAMACSESGVKTVNATPEAYITSHASGDAVAEGDTETILGQVADSDHPLSELTTAWLYNGEPVCTDAAPDDAGSVSCDVTFTTDGGNITLTARDPDGESATARVSLNVQATDAPTADITAPTIDGIYYSDGLITLEGTVADSEDAPSDLSVVWTSDIAGELSGDFTAPDSEGNLLGAVALAEGEHFITLTVTDSTAKEGSDSVVVTVGPSNSSPTCSITAPESGSAGPEGDTVMFEGQVGDADVPANWLAVEWSSDKDGPIGSSTPDSSGAVLFPYDALTVDTHVITMTVTDEMGADCAANSVYAVGTSPVLNITAPTDGATLNHSDAVVFSATVTDSEDMPNEVALSWESDVDGVFSTEGADSAGSVTVSVSTLSPGDHMVTVTATDTDGLFVTDRVSFNLNQPPTTPTVTLSPDPAITNQTLMATATGSEDPEGTGTVTYAYEWFEDGIASAESASATFPASATAKGHTYRVQVTASDGAVDSAFGYAEVSVINAAPVLTGPTLSSETAIVGDVLTCTASATDIDPEDSPTVTYAWSDGSTGTTYTVTADDAFGTEITCTATADDADGGVATASASATVTNTVPSVDSVAVSPSTGQVGDALTCTATASDPDGETPTLSYAWSDGSTGPTYTIRDDDAVGSTIVCTATATDAYGLSDSDTASATVTNSAPSVDSVAIAPDPAYNSDTLVCSATAADPDGTAPTVTYEWAGGATGPELPLTSIIASPGDTITCTATATDAYGETASASATIEIGNRAPSITASLSPESPTHSSTLTCTASDVADADDDSTTVSFAWTIDGVPASATSSDAVSTLSDPLSSGDVVVCTATATDGRGGSTPSTATVTIENTAPEVVSITLSPSPVYTNDTITAVAVGEDADGDELTYSYIFTVNGETVQGPSPLNTLDGTVHFSKGDLVSAVVSPDDGSGMGGWWSSGSVAVQNSTPTAPSVSVTRLTSADGTETDLLCSVDAPSTDADGDAISYTIVWDVEGTDYTDTETAAITGDTVPSEALGADETWTCDVTPADDEATGTMASASIYVEYGGLPESEMSFSSLSFSGTLLDHDVTADGSARVLTTWGTHLYLYFYDPDGTPYEPIVVGDAPISWGAGVFASRVSGDTMVVYAYDGKLNYTYIGNDCRCYKAHKVPLWDSGYHEFWDAAIADDGRAVITYGDGATNVAWIDEDGELLSTESPFDIGAVYGTHVAMNQSTGAGIVASQKHSGDGIYYQRFNADFEWIDTTPVRMPAGNHYWYDGFTVGMNDNSEFVFLWANAYTKISMAFYDSSGSRVSAVERTTPSWSYYDVFRLRHQEIPLNGANFVMGEVYKHSVADGTTVDHFEYTPTGTLVSESSTSYTVSQGLTIRTDGWGNAVVRNSSSVVALYDYP